MVAPMPPFNVSRMPKTASLLAGEVRRRIVIGELPEGATLPSEAQLVVEWGVARSTAREALRILESEGLVDVRRGARGGVCVGRAEFDGSRGLCRLRPAAQGRHADHVLAVRVLLEAPAARAAAQSRSRRGIADRLQSVLDRQIADPDDSTGPVDFHRVLVETTGNPATMVFIDIIENICGSTARRARSSAKLTHADARRAQRSHDRLIALIRAADVDGAEEHWRRHLAETGVFLLEQCGDALDLVD